MNFRCSTVGIFKSGGGVCQRKAIRIIYRKRYPQAECRKHQADGVLLMVFLKIILSPILFNTFITDINVKTGSMSMKFTCDNEVRGLNNRVIE